MFVETYPAAALSSPVTYRRTETSALENLPTPLTYLFIGTGTSRCKNLLSSFRTGTVVSDLSSASALIGKMSKHDLPDAIFIDLPFNKKAISLFCLSIRDQVRLSGVVLIYNAARLDEAAIQFVRQNQLVDEVSEINSEDIDYTRKIHFLKKINSRPRRLTISWNSLNRGIPGQIRQMTPMKRTLDVVLAVAALVFLFPLFLLVAIAIRLESRGPVFYTSPRAGKGFRVFKFYKFRTMIVGADKKIADLAHLNQYTQTSSSGASFLKISNDPRVTRVGRILRKTSLDEIPQFMNVLKGDMSFVGNRPLPLYEASTLTTNESVERFMAPAGITGLWQIKKRGNDTMSVEERINLDISYARKANLIYDLWIMVRTPTALFQKSDA